MKAIYKRELKSYFNNVTGCLFISANLFFMGIYFTALHLLNGYPYIAYTVQNILFILLMATPVLTMKSLAEEKSQKTDQLLLTSPVHTSGIVLGKYLAMLSIFAIPVLIMCLYPVVLGAFGTVPYLENYVAILGYFLFGAYSIAVGMLISALTENLIIAAIGTFGALFIIYILKGLCSMISAEGNIVTKVLLDFDALSRLNALCQGTIDISAIVYLISFSAMILYLVYSAIEKRRYCISKSNAKMTGISVGSTVFIIAAVFLVNFGIKYLPQKYLNIDVTKEGIYDISAQTKEILATLDEDVTLYVLANNTDYDVTISEILKRYEDMSKHIKVEYKDPYSNPEFASKYDAKDAAGGSIIVEGSKRHRLINYDDLYLTEFNYETYSNEPTGIDAEGQISSAISYVISDNMNKLYTISGHDEAALSSDVTSLIAKGNVDIEDINLLQVDSIPDDASALLIVSPTIDYSKEDAKKVTDYIDNGGKIVMLSSYNDTALPNYDSIIERYGVKLYDGMVIEEDKDRYYQNPYFLLPEVGYSDATTEIKDADRLILMPYARPFTYDDTEEKGCEYTKLLYTSDKAFAKQNVANADNYDKESGDIDGPFTLGVSIKNAEAGYEILYFSSEALLNSNVDALTSGANSLMIVDGLLKMTANTDEHSLSIPAKKYELSNITVSTKVMILGAIFSVGVIPLAVLILGLSIWMRRRHR